MHARGHRRPLTFKVRSLLLLATLRGLRRLWKESIKVKDVNKTGRADTVEDN